MNDSFKIIAAAFAGKFKNHPELRKGFWSFAAALVFALVCLGYNATLSHSYYLNILDQAPMANTVAWVITTLAAFTIWFILNYVAFRTVFIWTHNEDLERNESLQLMLSVLLVVGLIMWDINVNLQGAKPVAQVTTVSIKANNSATIKASYDGDIKSLEAKIDKIKARYRYPDGSIHFEPHPVTSVSFKAWQSDNKRVNEIEPQIQDLRSTQTAAVKSELKDHSRDTNRYDSQVSSKTTNHTFIIKCIYVLVIVLSLYCANYSNTAFDVIGENPNYAAVKGKKAPKIGFGNSTPAPSTAQKNRISRLQAEIEKLKKGKQALDQPQTPNNIGDNTESTNPLLTEKNIVFLQKHADVVACIYAKMSYGEIKKETGKSKSTAQNVKRVMQSVNLIS